MNTPAFCSPEKDAPIALARHYVQLFTILFCEFFEGRQSRFVSRAVHGKASAFLRALEGIVRRVVLIYAIALVPDLPPARPAPAAKAKAAARPSRPVGAASKSLAMFRINRTAQEPAPAPSKRVPSSAASRDQADLRPLARRYEALVNTLEKIETAAQRCARRVQAVYARAEEIGVSYALRLCPEHARYVARDFAVLTTDVNEGLRLLTTPDSS